MQSEGMQREGNAVYRMRRMQYAERGECSILVLYITHIQRTATGECSMQREGNAVCRVRGMQSEGNAECRERGPIMRQRTAESPAYR